MLSIRKSFSDMIRNHSSHPPIQTRAAAAPPEHIGWKTDRQITRWQQQNSGSSQITALSLQYDPMGQLIGATNQDTASSAQLALNAFSYDPAGNRTALQLDSQLSNATFNPLNQLVTQSGANGSLHFTGTVNKPSTVTVGGQIARVDAEGNFDALVPVIPGVNQVTVTATEVNHPAVNSARTYQVTVSPVGAPLSGVSYDANGNLTAGGAGQTYEYDSLDRVTAINESATLRTEFAYDGLGRRVQIIERSGGAIRSEQSVIYDGWNLAEQRDTANNVVRRYFGQGEQRLTTADSGNYFYTFDHLGSVRELLDNTGVVRARYDHDLWGNRTKLSGDLDCDFGFTSYWLHLSSGLYLSPTRLYSSAFGRFLSRDPIGEKGGINLHRYVGNDPVNAVDPNGAAIIWLNDTKNPRVLEHAGILIGNNRDGWTYFAKNGAGDQQVENDEKHYGSLSEFEASLEAVRFDRALLYSQSAQEDQLMIMYGESRLKRDFDLVSNNCGNLTENILLYGGSQPVPGASRGLPFIPIIPFWEYLDLKRAPGWTPISLR